MRSLSVSKTRFQERFGDFFDFELRERERESRDFEKMSRRSSNRKRCAKLGKLRASEELGLNSFVKENMSECKEALGLTSRYVHF